MIKNLLCLLFVILVSCSKEGDPIANRKVFASDNITTENVSYDNYVKPLLTKNCATCHGDGGSAETWWRNTSTYANALQYSRSITTTINNGTMPPPPKFPFADRDRELILAWINRGVPEN
ncbi:MAG: cytochrome c [Bacteroidota bacterium]